MRDYSDLTVAIPVRIEGDERRRNLAAVLENLSQYDGLRVIVLEADDTPKLRRTPYAEVVFVEDRTPLFYRTKYINQLCRMCRTPYIGVWDTDVVVPRPQFDEALELLRDQKADMVYPYDGRFYNVSGRALEAYFEQRNEEQLHLLTQSTIPVWGRHSCGGAFLADRSAYVAAGGENEAFRGWGPEDLERYKRWEIQGYRVARVQGPIFHLDHPRGPNSRYFDSELMRSTMQTLFATCRTQPKNR